MLWTCAWALALIAVIGCGHEFSSDQPGAISLRRLADLDVAAAMPARNHRRELASRSAHVQLLNSMDDVDTLVGTLESRARRRLP